MRGLLVALLSLALFCTACGTSTNSDAVLLAQVHNPNRFVVDTTINATTGKRAIQGAPFVLGGMILRYGFMQPNYRDSVLAKAYNDVTPQLEEGGCIVDWHATEQTFPLNKGPRVYIRTDSVYFVSELGPNQPDLPSGPASKIIKCNKGQPQWHVHPPQTCTNRTLLATCRHGGWEAYQCGPSVSDLVVLQARGAPFDIVRCGPNQWMFYFFLGNWNSWERKPPVIETPDSSKTGAKK